LAVAVSGITLLLLRSLAAIEYCRQPPPTKNRYYASGWVTQSRGLFPEWETKREPKWPWEHRLQFDVPPGQYDARAPDGWLSELSCLSSAGRWLPERKIKLPGSEKPVEVIVLTRTRFLIGKRAVRCAVWLESKMGP
jgi:hypothetical protein